MEDKKSFLRFRDVGASPSGLTTRWAVTNRTTGQDVGTISWYASWRRYAFWPYADMIFDVGCLTQIAEFIETAMGERKS